MKVPRINVGVAVSIPVGDTTVHGAISEVDFIKKEFRLHGAIAESWGFHAYHPSCILSNFLRAIAEWDYHYRASDDPRLYEEGQEYGQALIELFRSLPQDDQHTLRKVAEIVTVSVIRPVRG